MNVISYLRNQVNHIVVKEELKTGEDRTLFDEALKKKYHLLEINFLDARTLPAIVIDQLASLTAKHDHKLKIYVCHRVLSSYLFRLKIRNTLLEDKKSAVHKTKKNLRAVAMGGSAGGPERMKEVIKKLPVMDISIFVVIHIPEDESFVMNNIFRNLTEYSVVIPKSNTLVRTRTIYIAPPGFHMIVVGDHIYLIKGEKVNYARPSIDVLFESLANEYGEGLLAVLFSGYGRDGSSSLEVLKREQATIIIQDPQECEAKDMTSNAISTKNYDFIFTMDKITGYISSMADAKQEETDDEIKGFLQSLFEIYGYDFREYQIESVKRRIKSAMFKEKIPLFSEFKKAALADYVVFERLFLELSINVTTFFRNPEAFKVLREKIFPYLNSFHHLKIWCAGCATGEEPYSLAILLDELGMLKKTMIYATDFNYISLEQAKNGLYPVGAIEVHKKNYAESGGERKFSDYFSRNDLYLKINKRLQEKVLFFRHNLTTDGIFNEFQLILCRNVTIYFGKILHEKVLKLFSDSLDISGFLLLGESGNIMTDKGNNYFKAYNGKHRIFKKNPEKD